MQIAHDHPEDWAERIEEMFDMADERTAPPGWTRIVDNVGRGGGLIYIYPKGVLPNGETEFHLTKEELHRYVFPNRE